MKAKSIFITILLSLSVVSAIMAQDTYDYGVIRFDLRVNGNDTLKTYVPKHIAKGIKAANQHGNFSSVVGNQKILIQQIEKAEADGWEVYGDIYKEDGKMNYPIRKKKTK